jgi:hypothetical protein
MYFIVELSIGLCQQEVLVRLDVIPNFASEAIYSQQLEVFLHVPISLFTGYDSGFHDLMVRKAHLAEEHKIIPATPGADYRVNLYLVCRYDL